MDYRAEIENCYGCVSEIKMRVSDNEEVDVMNYNSTQFCLVETS